MHSIPEKPRISTRPGGNRPIDGENLLFLMQDVLSVGAFFRFQAKGWSMSPFIRDGDVVTVAPYAKVRPSVGRVVAYVQLDSGRLVIHRVIDRQGTAFLIQGDNAIGESDGLVIPQNILGCVIRVERSGRRVYLGLGLERYLMAVLARNGLLPALMGKVRALKNRIKKTTGN